MHRINKLLTLTSLSVLLVTIERFSFTTKVLFQPYSFIRLHELVQMSILILLTVIIPFLVLREVTDNFQALKSRKGLYLGILFITGIYFYSTGNGVHEIASFIFNNFCDTKNIAGDICGGSFINDYYTGNILYFIGAFFMNLILIWFERDNVIGDFKKKDLTILVINAVIYSFAIFAYAAFDRVLVGLFYSLIMTPVIYFVFWKNRKRYISVPFTTYLIISYTIGTLASLVVRFH